MPLARIDPRQLFDSKRGIRLQPFMTRSPPTAQLPAQCLEGVYPGSRMIRYMEDRTMREIGGLLMLLLFGIVSSAWAGPAEDIAQIDQQAIQCFNEGNLDKCLSLYADDAVSTVAGSPFRLEGKEALQANYAGTFQIFPTRRFLVRQTAIRVYGGDTGVLNRYFTLTLVDRAGNASTLHGRQSVTFVKLGTQWRIADVHTSRLP